MKIEEITVSADMDLTDGKEIYVEHSVEVDNVLSETSENPVQNKVVTAALNGKVDIVQAPNTILATGPPGQVQAMALGNALQINGQSVEVKTVNEMEDSTLPADANSDDLVAAINSEVVPVSNGGTGATSAANARTNLGITPENIGAADEEHTHSASDITSGTMSISRLPTITVAKGGTGATTAAQARVNLGVDISQETIDMFADAGYPIE